MIQTMLFDHSHQCIFHVHFCTYEIDMEWNDVRIFLVVARSGFFGEAAQALAESMEDSARGI